MKVVGIGNEAGEEKEAEREKEEEEEEVKRARHVGDAGQGGGGFWTRSETR